MGQQQTVARATLRRIVLALAIAAVMASAAPAFAASGKAKGASASLEADQVAYNTMANNLNNLDNPGRGGREVTAKYAKDNQGIDDIAH